MKKEQELLRRIRENDESAATYLLTHYGSLLRYVIRPILSNEQDREECLQDCVLRAIEKAELFDETRGSMTAFLTTIARNLALNQARTLKQHLPIEEIEPMAQTEETPETIYLKKERIEQVKVALAKLSLEERMIFYRKYYYLQPMAQIAAEMGLSERALEGKWYRAKKKLRKLLGGEEYEGSGI